MSLVLLDILLHLHNWRNTETQKIFIFSQGESQTVIESAIDNEGKLLVVGMYPYSIEVINKEETLLINNAPYRFVSIDKSVNPAQMILKNQKGEDILFESVPELPASI